MKKLVVRIAIEDVPTVEPRPLVVIVESEPPAYYSYEEHSVYVMKVYWLVQEFFRKMTHG